MLKVFHRRGKTIQRGNLVSSISCAHHEPIPLNVWVCRFKKRPCHLRVFVELNCGVQGSTSLELGAERGNAMPGLAHINKVFLTVIGELLFGNKGELQTNTDMDLTLAARVTKFSVNGGFSFRFENQSAKKRQ